MARLKRSFAEVESVRDYLARRARVSVARHGEVIHDIFGRPVYRNPAVDRLAALDAGEPVTVASFELPRKRGDRPWGGRWIVGADNGLQPAPPHVSVGQSFQASHGLLMDEGML